MKCPVCGNNGKKIFNSKILNKYIVNYYNCGVCACIFTESPYWLEESYSDSISALDTGIMERNVTFAIDSNYIISKFFTSSGKFIDFAGGYGIFTRMMRDLGYDFYWYDKFSTNLLARGYEISNASKAKKAELITAFEAFEHFDKPMEELSSLTAQSDNILFSTLLYDTNHKIPPKKWWYYGFETGQHITFYSEITLKYMAAKIGLNYVKINSNLHLFTKKSINPHRIQMLNRPLGKIQKIVLFHYKRRFSRANKDMYIQKAKYFS